MVYEFGHSIFGSCKLYQQATACKTVFRRLDSIKLAFCKDLLNTTAPTLDKPRQKEHMSNLGIMRVGFMKPKKIVQPPSFRKDARIANTKTIIIHANLYWRS